MLILALAGCSSFRSSVLLVEPEPVLLDSGVPVKELTIFNQGAFGSVLRWHASPSSPLIHVSPASGEVRAGPAGQRVRVSVDFSSLQLGSVAEAEIVIASNGGAASVPVRFEMSSARACQAAQPQSLSSRRAGRPPAADFVPGELLVGYREPVPGTDRDGSYQALSPLRDDTAYKLLGVAVRQDHGLQLLARGPSGSYDRLAAVDPEAAAEALAEDPRVAFAHPNYYVRPLALPDDPCYFEQWNLQAFGVPEAWELDGDGRVVVAVIDTGVDVDHEDLRSKSLPGYDVRDRDDDPRPGGPGYGSAHGTHVAGVALANGNNGVGVTGVAYRPEVKLLPVKIFDDSGLEATTQDLVDAILWSAGLPVAGLPANQNPADVINMSVGAGPRRIAAIDWAASRARDSGAVLLAAAGNNTSTGGELGVQSPANSPDVIAVGSVDSDLRRSSFSDWGSAGPTVDLMAPGGYGPAGCRRIRSTVPWSDYDCMAGTSMAAPFASGVAALLLSREPDLSPDRVKARLQSGTYFDPGNMSPAEYGSGILCADRVLAGGPSTPSRHCGSP